MISEYVLTIKNVFLVDVLVLKTLHLCDVCEGNILLCRHFLYKRSAIKCGAVISGLKDSQAQLISHLNIILQVELSYFVGCFSC